MTIVDEAWDSWSRASLGNERFLQPDTYRLCFNGGWHARHPELEKLTRKIETLTREAAQSKTRIDHAFMYAQLRQADCNFVESKLDAIGRIAFDKIDDTEKITRIIEVVVEWSTDNFR